MNRFFYVKFFCKSKSGETINPDPIYFWAKDPDLAHDGLTRQPCDLESNEFLVGEVPAEPHRREVAPSQFPEQKYHTYNVMDRHRSDANPDPTSILGTGIKIRIRIPPQVYTKKMTFTQLTAVPVYIVLRFSSSSKVS